MKAIETIASALKSITTEKYDVIDDTIEFAAFPLIIDVCKVTNTLYLHDYGFGDGPEGITDYYVGKYPKCLLKRIPAAIEDVKRRIKND